MSRKHFMGKPQIARASERVMEREVKSILKGYARKWREREKEYGADITEIIYGERKTYKQLLNEYVGEGKLKYRNAYRRLREEDIELTMYTKRPLEGLINKAENKYKDLDKKEAVRTQVTENYLWENYREELEEFGIVDLSDLSDGGIVPAYIENTEEDIDFSDLGRRAHTEFKNIDEFKAWIIGELKKQFVSIYGKR